MRIQVEKFLAITALLASTAALGVGCTTEDTATNTDAGVGGVGGGGSGGTAGSATGGAAGTAATGGMAGSGGVAGGGGAAGGGGVAGAAGGDGGACLGDAGTELVDCTAFSYSSQVCGDAGTEGLLLPLGVDLCNYMVGYGRPGVIEKIYACLNAITGDGCTSAHDTAVQKCMDDNFGLACQHDPFSDGDGGLYYPCKDVAESCPPDDAGTGGITEAECNGVLNALSVNAVTGILTCYDTPVSDCVTDFQNCVGLP